MSWFDECFRKLFFDFHNHDLVDNIAAEFNAEAWAKQLHEIGVQAVNVFTNDMFGWKYYRKGQYGYIHPNLPEDLDMVEETVRACHIYNIRVIAYFAPQRPRFIRDTKPEWLLRDKDANLTSIVQNGLCKIGPVGSYELIPQVQEITSLYDVDGIFFDGTYALRPCYCEHCRKEFLKDTGYEIPVDEKDRLWKLYLKWYLDKHTEFKLNMIKAAHSGNPNVMVGDNWAYTYRLAEKMPKDIDFLCSDVFPDNQLFNSSLLARSNAMTGKPFDIMNTGFLKWWGEWGIKPALQLKRECASILANGGRTCIGYQLYPQFKVERAVMDTFKEVFEFVKEREQICRDSVIEPYIGVFFSSINRGITHGNEVWPDVTAVSGIHKLLTDAGIHYNLLSDQFLIEKIFEFKMVILPDTRYLTTKVQEAVRDYVREGGSILVTGLTGTLNDCFMYENQCLIEEVLGIQMNGIYPHTHAYMDINDELTKMGTVDMPILIETEFAYVKPVTAKVLANLRGLYTCDDGAYTLRYSPPGENTGYPSITINSYGKGKAVYIAGDIFAGYYTGGQWNLVHLIKNIMYQYLIKERLVEIQGTSNIEVILAKKNSNTLVHLINCTGDTPATGSKEIYCITREIVPIYDMEVRLYMKKDPIRIVNHPSNELLNWIRHREYIYINVPKLEIHSCLEVEIQQ